MCAVVAVIVVRMCCSVADACVVFAIAAAAAVVSVCFFHFLFAAWYYIFTGFIPIWDDDITIAIHRLSFMGFVAVDTVIVTIILIIFGVCFLYLDVYRRVIVT